MYLIQYGLQLRLHGSSSYDNGTRDCNIFFPTLLPIIGGSERSNHAYNPDTIEHCTYCIQDCRNTQEDSKDMSYERQTVENIGVIGSEEAINSRGDDEACNGHFGIVEDRSESDQERNGLKSDCNNIYHIQNKLHGDCD